MRPSIPERTGISRRSLLRGLGVGIVGSSGVGLAPILRRDDLPSTRPKIVGHRGAEGLAPPNTIAGIEAALEVGVDGVELDVWRTADGRLLCFHDAVLDWRSTAEGVVDHALDGYSGRQNRR